MVERLVFPHPSPAPEGDEETHRGQRRVCEVPTVKLIS
jgi:hypothetical protein